MNNDSNKPWLTLKKNLLKLPTFIRIKRLKELILHVSDNKLKKELINMLIYSNLEIQHKLKLREEAEINSLEERITLEEEELVRDNRSVEEIVEEETVITQKKIEETGDIIYNAPDSGKPEEVYSIHGSSDENKDSQYSSLRREADLKKEEEYI